MKLTRAFLIFTYGLFTIAAQSLLFREFITTFEGNDISVGIFFGSWFLWVALGAILVYRAKTFSKKLLNNIEFLLLAFLPAFILEWLLIVQARELAGVESYALLSVRAILLLSVVINAPVSIITGMLFPVACRWLREDGDIAVSQVYIIEAAGSFLGGTGATVLLGLGVSPARIFFILAFILSLSAVWVQIVKAKRWVWVFVPVFILVSLFAGADDYLSRQIRIIKWNKLLPQGQLKGSFQTAQAEYLYGDYQGQWIVLREGSTCEVLPDYESAGRIAAISLCQKPDATRILVIGSGLSLCRQLLHLPQIENVTWAHCDNEYVQEINKFIPTEFRIDDKRFEAEASDIRSLLNDQERFYDIVIINLPDATSSVLNRYYTLEFYSQIKKALRPNGVLAVRVAGGENIMGTELINLGASTKLTLQKVFSQLVLAPGDDTWFVASDSENLTGRPGTLRDRFASIDGGADIFPPQALLSVYLPDRAAVAMESYAGTDLPESLLINRDARPLAHLYSLLLTAKQSDAPVARLVKYFALAGSLVFIIPILVFLLLRIIYIVSLCARMPGQESRASSFDGSFLIFSAGLTGIGVVIVLMFLYQTHFGSLYLYIGIISSLFMVGLTTGAVLSSHLVKRISYLVSIIFAVVIAHALILTVISFWPDQGWTHLIFAIVFILCGVCAGCYFPLVAKLLSSSSLEPGQIGSKLESADHIGASIGGLLTGLALVPVLGTNVTLFVFILLLLVNVPLVILRTYKPAYFETGTSDLNFKLRRRGYILFGIGATVILCSNLLAEAGMQLLSSLPQYSARALAGDLHLEHESAVFRDSGRKADYFKVSDANDKLTGYIFSTEDLSPEVRGFGGKINLAVYVDPDGTLINFHIIQSNETPAYLEMLGTWRGLLGGRGLFEPKPFANVQAVTGATVSSKAILSALEISGRRFAAQILNHPVRFRAGERISLFAYKPDRNGVYLIVAFALALIVTYRGGFWSRLAVLLFTLVVGGVLFKSQYSSEQMATVLSLHVPVIGLSGVFLLTIAIPLLVIIFGNIYCGYICPFGAMQELLSYIVPKRFKRSVTKDNMRKARFIKYIVLFVFIIVFFFSRNRTTLAADPLVFSFNLKFWHAAGWSILVIVTFALIGSLFYTRFWCRYLCPAGAFLSLFNKIAILKRYVPAKKFAMCEFGLTARDNTDCIYCDRCRFQAENLILPSAERGRYFVAVVLIIAVFVSGVSVHKLIHVIPDNLSRPAVSVSSGGQPREVDLQRVRTMIEQKKLSDREAEFYKKVE
jgi:predicted membrane-bound spermidine synthase